MKNFTYCACASGEKISSPERSRIEKEVEAEIADAFAFAETLLTQPVMVVVGQNVGAFGAFRDGMEIYGRAIASKDRQLVSLEDCSHYDLYDKPEPVGKALDRVVPFFRRHVGADGAAAERREAVVAK